MKYRLLTLILVIFSFIFQNCQPLTTVQIETIVPANIEFPGSFNKVVFINLEKDLNNDQKTDTLLYKIITQEMNNGFIDAIKSTAGIDSSHFLYMKGFPDKNVVYKDDTISWQFLEKISNKSNEDIFIILDSLKLSMNNESYTDNYSYPVEYFKFRELTVHAFWSVFDLGDKKRLDKYYYNDTLYWEKSGYLKVDVEKKMPGVEQSIREASYFTAVDYANRIFPGWQLERRYYFVTGNKDFRVAAELAKNNRWIEAAVIWGKYTSDIDKEIASRACFNMALASEMTGKINEALAWAEKSEKIKRKSRTRYYVSVLKIREIQIEKLEKQIY
ncbi:MAG: hypothetical protein KOO66_09900 [Bacteroidales bacterium]|nr:hypothetical protein [Bacteroidales bacterium]